MSHHILLDRFLGEDRWALMDAGQVIALGYVCEHDPHPQVGAIYAARVLGLTQRPLAADLDLGRHGTAYLPLGKRRASTLAEGQLVPVRIRRPADDRAGETKRATATYLPDHPLPRQAKTGLITPPPSALHQALTAAGEATISAIMVAGPALYAACMDTLKTRQDLLSVLDQAAFDTPLFADHGVEDVIADIARGQVPIPGGGSVLITPTPGLVAMDVNAGAGDMTAINTAAMKIVAQQLRLANWGGLIIIDLAGSPKAAVGKHLSTALRQATAADPRDVQIIGPSAFGVIELTRAKVGIPLTQRLASPVGQAMGHLRQAARDAMHAPPGHLRLALPAKIKAVITSHGLDQRLAQHLGRPISLEIKA